MSTPLDVLPQQENPNNEFSVLEVENPNSVINLVSTIPKLHNALNRVLTEDPDLFDLDFYEIKNKAKPTLTLSRLRQSLWAEYEQAVSQNRKIKLSRVLAGICTDTFFTNKVIPDNEKIAYLMCPPNDYLVVVKEALTAGLDTLRLIVGANVFRGDGSLDHKAADMVIKAVALLDMRVKGAIVQKIDQRTVSMNVNRTEVGALPRSVEELDRELDAVKAKLLNSVTAVKLPTNAQALEAKIETLDVKPLKFGRPSGE